MDSYKQDQSVDNNIYDQYERALTEADYSRIRAHEEAIRRGEAEKDLLEAVQRVKFLTRLVCFLYFPEAE